MPLTRLSITQFRNIAAAELDLSPQFNLIVGANGSGKTSLLEAIYYLGRVKSFRTRHLKHLIQEDRDFFRLVGQLNNPAGSSRTIGIERRGQTQMLRLGGQPVQQLAELVKSLPIQLLNPDSHLLLEGGPRYRRRFLDWGVFHVEHAFYPAWQRYTKALKQRNAALRQSRNLQDVAIWNPALIETAMALHELRQNYLSDLLPYVEANLTALVDLPRLDFHYQPGWQKDAALNEVLDSQYESDARRGFTQSGPHRADLVPMLGGVPAIERISRGQQKQLVTALLLAQAELMMARNRQSCVFLIDDLPSELDEIHRERVLSRLLALKSQIYVTTTDEAAIPAVVANEMKRFHVEHGKLQEMVY